MTNIHNEAHKLSRKPTKDQAAGIIEALWQKANDDDKFELERLYKYFQPALPKRPKTVLQWVAKARSKEQVRYYITEIYSTGKEAVATNGHIAFIAPYNGEVGYITPDGHALSDFTRDATFPQWERIVPDGSASVVSLDDFEISENGGYILRSKESDQGFDKVYLDLCLAYGGKYVMHWNKDGCPMLIVFDDGRKAVIMPKRHA